MKIVFSFSLFGNNRKYSDPLFVNLDIIKSNFFNYEVNVYYDNSVPSNIINELKNKGVNLLEMKALFNTSTEKMSWRYAPIFNIENECCIIRDTDSLISNREIQLINEWINTTYNFHIIRDHPLHNMPIMGGLFAIKNPLFDKFKKQYDSKFSKYITLEYNGDQLFLAHEIYPFVLKESLIQTSCFSFMFEKVQFIKKTDDFVNYIGAVNIGDKDYNTYLTKLYELSKIEIGMPYLFYKIINFRAISFFTKILSKFN